MKLSIGIICILLLPFKVFSSSQVPIEIKPLGINEWTYLTSTGDDYTGYDYYGRNSYIINTKKGTSIDIEIIPRKNNHDVTITDLRVFVPIEDCSDGFGYVASYSMTGRLIKKYDYMTKKSDVSGLLGDIVCDIRKREEKHNHV